MPRKTKRNLIEKNSLTDSIFIKEQINESTNKEITEVNILEIREHLNKLFDVFKKNTLDLEDYKKIEIKISILKEFLKIYTEILKTEETYQSQIGSKDINNTFIDEHSLQKINEAIYSILNKED